MENLALSSIPTKAKVAVGLALIGWLVLAANIMSTFSAPTALKSRILSIVTAAFAIAAANLVPLPTRNYVARAAMLLAGTLMAASLMPPSMLAAIFGLHLKR
ncbi:MAG: hypothetical protein ABIY70_15805 [Capsulimonas sp.]|uniref:hypothetical protein n=1 Tax=Capsulimonas sp. TaxID=2494211 RepID=UPI0032652621